MTFESFKNKTKEVGADIEVEVEKKESNNEVIQLDPVVLSPEAANWKFKENDFIIPEGDNSRAKNLLESVNMKFEEIPYTEGKQLTKDTWVPAEFIITIKNAQGEDVDSSTSEQLFSFLKDSGIILRYGKTPGSEVE